jgi:hypothetical protein
MVGAKTLRLYRIILVTLLGLSVSSTAAADCVTLCETSFESCASTEAAGCSLVGAATQKAASKLLSGVAYGGMISGMLSQGSEEACKAKLLPCEQLRDQCLNECGLPGSSAQQQTNVVKSTLRVFSDQPRTLIYINGQRMGATPDDPLSPFITPEMTVGKYWLRLVNQDGTLSWEGSKSVDEGNINAVEAVLRSSDDLALEVATKVDEGGDSSRASTLYQSFLTDYPSSKHRAKVSKRAAELKEKLIEAERVFFAEFEAQEGAEHERELAELYLEKFPNGASLTAVNARKKELDSTLDSARERLKPLHDMAEDIGPYDKSHELGFEIGRFVQNPDNAEVADEAKALGRQYEIWHDPSEYSYDQIWKLERSKMPSLTRGLFIAEGFVCVAGGTAFAIFADEVGAGSRAAAAAFLTVGTGLTTTGFLIRSKQRKRVREKYGL